jgi:serine protease Do
VRFPEEIAPARQKIAQLPLNQSIKIDVLRQGKPMSFNVTTVKLESSVGEEREAKAWGLSVRDVTRAYANDRQLDDDQGVVITSLTRGFAGDKAELDEGDVIRAVNNKPVEDLDAFFKLFDEATEKKQPRVLLQIVRNRGVRDAVLKLTY